MLYEALRRLFLLYLAVLDFLLVLAPLEQVILEGVADVRLVLQGYPVELERVQVVVPVLNVVNRFALLIDYSLKNVLL